MRKNKVMATIVAVVLTIGLVVSGSRYMNASKMLSQTKADMEQTMLQKDKNTASQQTSMNNIMKEVTGVDTSRMTQDNKAADDFFRTIFDWKGGNQYMEARQYCMEKGIAEDSQFLTEFFSPINLTNDYDPLSDDRKVPLSMYYGSTDYRKLIGVQDDVYSYMAMLSVTTNGTYKTADGKEKKVEGTGHVMMSYSVDAEGNISNIDGYTVY